MTGPAGAVFAGPSRRHVTPMPPASSREMACSAFPTRTVSGPPKGSAARSFTFLPGTSASFAGSAAARRHRPERARSWLPRPARGWRASAGAAVEAKLSIRDRIAVRVVCRVAERAVDPRFELLGQRMLEPVGLGVHLVEAEPERLGEVELEEPVVADHLERDALAGRRQLDSVVRRVLGEPERGEAFHHRGHRRRADAHALRDGRRRRALALEPELVDLLHVVLHRVGQVSHHASNSNLDFDRTNNLSLTRESQSESPGLPISGVTGLCGHESPGA